MQQHRVSCTIHVVHLGFWRQEIYHGSNTCFGFRRAKPAAVAYIGLSALLGTCNRLYERYCQGSQWRTGKRREAVMYSVNPGMLAPPPSVITWATGLSAP